MSRTSKERSSARGLFGGLMRNIEQKIAQAAAPHMSDRFYEIYIDTVSETYAGIPNIEGLESLNMDSGYMSLLVGAAGEPDEPQKVWDALAQSPRLLLLGPVGSGKTTLLRSLAWRFAGQIDASSIRWLTFKLFGQSVQEMMPVLVDLEDWDSADTLMGLLLKSMAEHRFPGGHAFLLERLGAGQCILLLDGVDKLANPQRMSEISEMANAYPRDVWVAAGRPVPGLASIEGFRTLALRGIAGSDKARFISNCLGTRSREAKGLGAALERSAGLRALSEFPLMLAAMCRAVKKNARRTPRLPSLHDACLEMLLSEWPEYQTGQPAHYALKDQLNMLQYIAFEMLNRGCPVLPHAELLSLARQRLPAEHKGRAQHLLEVVGRHTGMLCLGTGWGQECGFVNPSLQGYLAAQWTVAIEKSLSLVSRAANSQWESVIILATALLADPLPFLYRLEAQEIPEPNKWFLLAHCIAETLQCDDLIYTRVQERLFGLFEEEPGEHWQDAAVALAGMQRLCVRDYLGGLVVNQRESPEMRRWATLALGRLKQDWAIPSLGAAISDNDASVRQQAAWALGFIPSRSAVNVLPRALKSPHQSIRKAAAVSLVQQAASPELTESVIAALISAISSGGDDDVDIVPVTEWALVQIGPVATPLLIKELNNRRLDPEQRSRIARTLGTLGDERALPILVDAILDGRPEEIDGYVEAVAGVGAQAIPALIEALHGKDISTSAGLVTALGRIGAPAVEPLIEAIAGDLPEVRNAAVRALEQIGSPAIEALTHALLFDSRYEVRRRALEILGRIGEEHVVSALVEALHDDDIGVRINAVRHLGSLGAKQPVPQLIELLQQSDQLSLRRVLIASLGAIGDANAIPTLIACLDDPELRSAATNALAQFADQVVEPLIKRIHDPATESETRKAAWTVLDSIGARARPSDQDLFGIAATYSRLRAADLPADEILTLTERITWWHYGLEVHESLLTAQTLTEACNLQEIDGCGQAFEWLADVDEWLRPHIQNVLWAFRDVIENTSVFHSLTRRDAQRNALVSAIDRLEEVRQWIEDTTLPFERGLLEMVASRWHSTIFNTIKTLRGRASLFVTLLTPSLPLRRGQQVCEAMFQVFNEGDSAARNVSVSVHSSDVGGGGAQVIGEERISLNPVGIGEERQVPVSLAPHKSQTASLVFDVQYDDDERQNVSHRSGFQIQFYNTPDEYQPIERSPYIVGMPVKTQEMFFGRQDIFEWVRENASNLYQEQPLLLYGERRVGKTSVLYQLLQSPPTPDHICLLFDLQLYGYIDTVQELLFELASAVVMRLQDGGMEIEYPDWDEYNGNPHRAFRRFCDLIDKRLGSQRLLIMLDEFGVLIGKVKAGTLDASIFDYLRGVTQHSNKFTFLFTGAYEVRRMQQDFNSILFNMPKVRKISYLTNGEAQDLIEQPIRNMLVYHPLVVPRILRITAGHPYFIQYICDELVKLSRKQETNYVELNDLEFVIGGVLRDAAGNIENSIYNYLGDSEKLVLAALAHVTDEVRVFVPLGDILNLLQRRHIEISREQVLQALLALQERDLVSEMRIGQQLRYSFKMGLTRRWLRQNEILLRIIQERES